MSEISVSLDPTGTVVRVDVTAPAEQMLDLVADAMHRDPEAAVEALANLGAARARLERLDQGALLGTVSTTEAAEQAEQVDQYRDELLDVMRTTRDGHTLPPVEAVLNAREALRASGELAYYAGVVRDQVNTALERLGDLVRKAARR